MNAKGSCHMTCFFFFFLKKLVDVFDVKCESGDIGVNMVNVRITYF